MKAACFHWDGPLRIDCNLLLPIEYPLVTHNSMHPMIISSSFSLQVYHNFLIFSKNLCWLHSGKPQISDLRLEVGLVHTRSQISISIRPHWSLSPYHPSSQLHLVLYNSYIELIHTRPPFEYPAFSSNSILFPTTLLSYFSCRGFLRINIVDGFGNGSGSSMEVYRIYERRITSVRLIAEIKMEMQRRWLLL